MWEVTETPVRRSLFGHLQNIGRAQEKLHRVLCDDRIRSTSKHDPYWDHTDPFVADKLNDIRMKLSWLEDELNDIRMLLDPESE